MNNLKICACVAALALTGFTGTAIAKDGQRLDQFFDRADADGNGAITSIEAQAIRDARFSRMDANGDGAVSLEEMSEAARKRRADRMAKRFERMDANGDGMLRRTEFEDAAARRFELMDANGDGALTKEEIREGFARRKGG